MSIQKALGKGLGVEAFSKQLQYCYQVLPDTKTELKQTFILPITSHNFSAVIAEVK